MASASCSECSPAHSSPGSLFLQTAGGMCDDGNKKEGKQLGIAQNCFPGCVLDVFAYIDAA